jgi:hypothetical protein
MLACGDEPRDGATALFSAGKRATKRSGGIAINVDGVFRELSIWGVYHGEDLTD